LVVVVLVVLLAQMAATQYSAQLLRLAEAVVDNFRQQA
jgi:hypothetical protein